MTPVQKFPDSRGADRQSDQTGGRLKIAVVGAGAAGLSAAWLLSRSHDVTLLEKDDRLGGHAHTALLPANGGLPVDTGFIVYNETNYPNLVEWFKMLGVATENSDMSFAVSRDNGGFEYAGGPLFGLLAQPTLPFKPRFWSMLRGLLRFYREAPKKIPADSTKTLGEFLTAENYSDAFINDHLLPFGSAIWSTSRAKMLDYPAAAFIRFCDNHGLLNVRDRPQWRTVTGGSARYVAAARHEIGEQNVRTDFRVSNIERYSDHVFIHGRSSEVLKFDQVVIATHANQALDLIDDPDDLEADLLGRFDYEQNLAILHTDTQFLPKRRRAWCSWNYVERGTGAQDKIGVSYWMNRLQNIESDVQYVLTLNPATPPDAQSILRTQVFEHPTYTVGTWQAQQRLWELQGRHRCWFCGSYFGAGFHEDAVQAGLAVAEALGGKARPWDLASPSGRIVTGESPEHLPGAFSQTAANTFVDNADHRSPSRALG